MVQSQQTLFGKKIKQPSRPSKKYNKTKKQLDTEGRAARDSLMRQLGNLGQILDSFPKSDEHDGIITQLKQLKTTDDYKILEECKARNVGSWVNHIDEWLNFLVKQCERGKTASGRRWVKFKVTYAKESQTGAFYYTCCGHHVGGSRWIVMASSGQVRCRKCFVEAYKASQFKQIPEIDPLTFDFSF